MKAERAGKLKSWAIQTAATRLWNRGLDQRPEFRADIVGALRLAFRAGMVRGVAVVRKGRG